MPSFETPEPISATIELAAGDVRVSAGDRTATTVTVEPTDHDSEDDRRVAETTRVEYADGRLLVKGPKLRSWLPRSAGGSIDVRVELPAGSGLHADAAMADFTCDGRLGDARIKTGLGRIQLEQAAAVNLKSGIGDIVLERATGHAEVTVSSGEARLGELASTAVVKNSNGDTWIGSAGNELRARAANGDIAVDVAAGNAVAKSSNGDVRIGEVARGKIVLETRLGDLELGIREGVAAWLDVRAVAGRVHNALDAAEAPDPSAETVSVRARTHAGDVTVRRA